MNISNTERDEKAIVILEATFNPNGMNTPEFQEYSRRSNANGEAHGGVVLNKFRVTENLGQGESPHIVMVVEYPSHKKAKETFANPEYLDIIPLRDVAFHQVRILFTSHL